MVAKTRAKTKSKTYVATSIAPTVIPMAAMSIYACISNIGAMGVSREHIDANFDYLPKRTIGILLSTLSRRGLIRERTEPVEYHHTMTVDEAKFVALLNVENALVHCVKKSKTKPTRELNLAFVRYQKLKELALRPGTTHEGNEALKRATIELIRLIM
jgi:hypothetical protein